MNRSTLRPLVAGLAALATLPFSGGAHARLGGSAAAPIASQTNEHPFLFSLPAPRGRILDRNGEVLANSKVVYRASLAVPLEEGETADSFAAEVLARATALQGTIPELAPPSAEAIRSHFEHRRLLPITLANTLSENGRSVAAGLDDGERRGLRVQPWWVRHYPSGPVAAHTLGYVTRTGPPLAGPLHEGELLWPEVEGRAGLEAWFNKSLTGEAGTLSVTLGEEGDVVREEVAVVATPGADVVTALDIRLQKVAEGALESSGHAGAIVVIDPVSGDIVAMASRPTFDPASFVPAISEADFARLEGDPGKPLFPRAVAGEYPPGSVFKPVMALGAMDRGAVNAYTTYAVGPYLEIDGRRFHNWSDDDNGLYDLKAALVRSQNTWFFQAAIDTGDGPILWAARQLGYAEAPKIPLPSVAAGLLPEKVPSSQGLANLAIGQGDVLASPLQVALSMAGIANGNYLPRPRLVIDVQSGGGAVLREAPVARRNLLGFYTNSLRAVHSGLQGVVNHAQGTAKAARLAAPTVFGKTGTAQWKGAGGAAESSVAWFAGFVKECAPPLAFVVMLEGEPGEKIFGGSAAAPVAGRFLETVFAAPGDFGIGLRDGRARAFTPVDDTPLGHQRPAIDPAGVPRAIPLATASPEPPRGVPRDERNIPKAVPVEPIAQAPPVARPFRGSPKLRERYAR